MAQDIETTDASATDAALGAASADQKIAELEAQCQEASDRALRSHAELENYRKRTQRELAEERRYAIVPLVRDLLSVVDNLERAMEATQARSVSEGPSPATTDASLLEGVKLVATQLETILQQHQCVRIETVGSAFDPNFHQAIAQEPSSEHPAGTITRAAQAGFKLEGRVIRPAQVFVSTGPATS